MTIIGGANASTADAHPDHLRTHQRRSTGVDRGPDRAQTIVASIEAGGGWSATSAILPNGTYLVAATVTDRAGNIGTATQSLTIDTILPVVSIVHGATFLTNDPTPTIAGTTDVTVGSVCHSRPSAGRRSRRWCRPATRGTHAVGDRRHDHHGHGLGGRRSRQPRLGDSDPDDRRDRPDGDDHRRRQRAHQRQHTRRRWGVDRSRVSSHDQRVGPVVRDLVQPNGSWTATAPFGADGSHPVSVSVTDPAGNTRTVVQRR